MKILHTAPLQSGGITSFVLNITTKLNTDDYKVYNLCFRNQKEFSEDRFINAGGIKKVIDVENIRFKPYKMLAKYKGVYRIIKEESIDIFHLDTDTADQVFMAIAAKKAGAKVIYHSHNSETWRKGFLWKLINEECKKIMIKYVDYYLACSDSAARYLFPKQVLEKHRYSVVTNGIDLDKYIFNEEIRELYRKKNNLDGKFVIGHVGRFNKQKNHIFLLDVFTEVLKKKENAVLLLIGEGELYADIVQKAADLGISDNIIFYGKSSEVYNLMQAMDAFVFPSLYEGLPVAGVEAQATDLPLFLSDTITRELQMTDHCIYLPLGDAERWANTIISETEKMCRCNTREELVHNGYDINQTVNFLSDIYRNLCV